MWVTERFSDKKLFTLPPISNKFYYNLSPLFTKCHFVTNIDVTNMTVTNFKKNLPRLISTLFLPRSTFVAFGAFAKHILPVETGSPQTTLTCSASDWILSATDRM